MAAPHDTDAAALLVSPGQKDPPKLRLFSEDLPVGDTKHNELAREFLMRAPPWRRMENSRNAEPLVHEFLKDRYRLISIP